MGYRGVQWGTVGYSGGTVGYCGVLLSTVGYPVQWGSMEYCGVLWGTVGYCGGNVGVMWGYCGVPSTVGYWGERGGL